jgi:hypothetical protein
MIEPQHPPFPQAQQNETRRKSSNTDPRGMLQQKLVSAVAKPPGSELLLTRQGFSVQDDPRQNLKICPETLEMILLNIFLKFCTLSVA